MPVEQIQSMGALQMTVSTITAELTSLEQSNAKLTDAHRKLKGASKKKRIGVKQARTEERKKSTQSVRAAVKAHKDAAKAARAERVAAERARGYEQEKKKACAGVQANLDKLQADLGKREKQVQLARKRARDSEAAQAEAVGKVEELKAKVEQLEADAAQLKAKLPAEAADGATPATKGRRGANGRFQATSWQQRPLIWAQLGRCCAPSAINANISEVLRVYAPDVVEPVSCERQIQKQRGELTIASEAMAFLRIGRSLRILSWGGDESTKFGKSIFACNFQIERHDRPGEIANVVPRGASLMAGGTAEKTVEHIKNEIFGHGKVLLTKWMEYHEAKFGSGSYLADGGASPDSIGLHRLSERVLVQGDSCATMRKVQRLIVSEAEAAGRARIGEEAWANMTEPQRALTCKTYTANCHGHLRNIVIKGMMAKAVEWLRAELQDDLAEIGFHERVSIDPFDLMNGHYKLMHAGATYALGLQREFGAVVAAEFPSALVLPFANTHGERQDIKFEGLVPVLINRLVTLAFLKPLVNVPGKKQDHQLARYLYTALRCNHLTALARVGTLFHYVLTSPMRCLAGKGAKLQDWSVVKMNDVLNTMASTLGEVAADGNVLLDPNLDPFAPIAEQQPLFAKWREDMRNHTVKSANGTVYHDHVVALAQARSPADGSGGKQATAKVTKLAEMMARAGIDVMRDPKRAIAELLTAEDGTPSACSSVAMHEATMGANVTNDPVEACFAKYDRASHMFRYATVENLAGVAQQMANHDFDMPPNVAHDRRNSKAPAPEHTGGFFHTGLNVRLQESLTELGRLEAPKAAVNGRLSLAAHDQHKLEKREDRLQSLLDAAVLLFVESMELFKAWEASRATTRPQVEAAIKDKPEAQQLEYLRRQIEMRTKGLGWTQFATRWSSCSDARIGTVAHLKALLLDEIIPEERALERLEKLPTDACPPHLTSRDIPSLGELDADAESIERKSIFSAEQLKAKAEEEMARRVAAGIWDDVEALNPDEAPPFDQNLVDKELEVLWKYFDEDTKQPHLIWAPMRVKRIADGLTDKRTKLARTLLPAGAVLVAWEADPAYDEAAGEMWLTLLPKKWKKQQHYSWRYAPSELARMRGLQIPERRQQPPERANLRRADK